MTTWGRVYYTNAIACATFVFYDTLRGIGSCGRSPELQVDCLPLVSCFCGVAIAYFAFPRVAISATYFTVVGNMQDIDNRSTYGCGITRRPRAW